MNNEQKEILESRLAESVEECLYAFDTTVKFKLSHQEILQLTKTVCKTTLEVIEEIGGE